MTFGSCVSWRLRPSECYRTLELIASNSGRKIVDKSESERGSLVWLCKCAHFKKDFHKNSSIFRTTYNLFNLTFT